MSAFHRVDDILTLPGRTLWKLAWRLPHYRGCMRDVVLQEGEQPAAADPAPASAGAPPLTGTAEALASHPAFAANGAFGPLFEVTKIPADAD